MAGFDVIVVGLGGMGSAAACHLANRGASVLGLEQYTAVHDRGSSHGGSRIIRQAYHEHPGYVPLVQRAYELWEKLEQDSGKDLLSITGGLMIGGPGSSVVNGTIRSTEEHSLPYEILNPAELQRRFPPLRPRSDDIAVFELRAGFLRPEIAVRAHLESAAKNGAHLHFEEKVKSWSANPSGTGVRIVTTQGTYEAERLILAPGAWAVWMLADLQVPFDVRRHFMCWFQPTGSIVPFLPQNFPIYIWDVDGHDIFYGFPAIDGIDGGAKVAMHSGGAPCAPENLDAQSSGPAVQELRALLASLIPSLDGAMVRAAPCMYTLTPDEHFVICLHPEFSQVSMAAGFSGHGFKFTSVVGEILADLAISGKTRHNIELFSPGRFSRSGEGFVTG